jgi:hypothetical protein
MAHFNSKTSRNSISSLPLAPAMYILFPSILLIGYYIIERNVFDPPNQYVQLSRPRSGSNSSNRKDLTRRK